jgi:hypothetical protein
VIGGAQFLGGFPKTSFMLGLTSGLFFLWLMLRDYRSNGAFERNLLLCLVTAAVTLALSAFQLAEFGKLLIASHTAHTASYGTVVKEPFWLLPLFLPNFFGTPFESFWINEISPIDHMPLSLFCGILTVLLATMALLWRAAPNRNYVWFFAALLFVFIAVGRLKIAFAIYALVVVTLLLMVPGRILWPSWRSFIPLIYVVPVFVTAFFLIRQWQWLRIGAFLFFALITFEAYLCAQAFGYLHYYGPKPPAPPSLAWLEKNVRHERIFGVNGIFPANTLIVNRIHDIRHLDAMYPAIYVDYADAIWPGARSNVYQITNPQWNSFSDPLLDLAAVTYVVFPRPLTDVPTGYREVYSDRRRRSIAIMAPSHARVMCQMSSNVRIL